MRIVGTWIAAVVLAVFVGISVSGCKCPMSKSDAAAPAVTKAPAAPAAPAVKAPAAPAPVAPAPAAAK